MNCNGAMAGSINRKWKARRTKSRYSFGATSHPASASSNSAECSHIPRIDELQSFPTDARCFVGIAPSGYSLTAESMAVMREERYPTEKLPLSSQTGPPLWHRQCRQRKGGSGGREGEHIYSKWRSSLEIQVTLWEEPCNNPH